MIYVTFTSTVLGNKQETIKLTYNNPSVLTDVYENVLETKDTSIETSRRYEVLNASEAATSDASGFLTMLGMVLGIGLSMGISMIMGGSLEATWLLLCTIQLMSMTPVLKLDLPTIFRDFSTKLIGLHGQFTAIPNMFLKYMTKGVNTDP